MRVLMFGWEFPPHISGGLGTACLGLTQSLVREDIELLFIVPRLFGNEEAEKVNLISASDVILPLPTANDQSAPAKSRKIKTSTILVHQEEGIISEVKSEVKLSVVEVEAALNPYEKASSRETRHNLERWNYVFEPGRRYTTSTHSEVEERIAQVPVGYTYSFSGSYSENMYEEVALYAKIAEELARKNEHDVIHAHDWMTYPSGLAAKKISGKPLVIHVHSTEFDRSGQCCGPVFEIELRAMQQADKIIAVSQWTKDILITHYKIDHAKIQVVHNGIFASQKVHSQTKTEVGSHVVTFLGRITHQKGPAYFVEAARKVLHEFPEAHFIVAGSGDLLPQTIERVAQLKLSTRFHFTGFLNKTLIDKIWAISNVYVMPSVSEPFGITPLEAIQAGVPVIVSNQSGVAEVMPHALKVDFWDVDALAESICSVLKYRSLSGMLKSKGKHEIKNLSWKNAALKIKRVYEEIAA